MLRFQVMCVRRIVHMARNLLSNILYLLIYSDQDEICEQGNRLKNSLGRIKEGFPGQTNRIVQSLCKGFAG